MGLTSNLSKVSGGDNPNNDWLMLVDSSDDDESRDIDADSISSDLKPVRIKELLDELMQKVSKDPIQDMDVSVTSTASDSISDMDFNVLGSDVDKPADSQETCSSTRWPRFYVSVTFSKLTNWTKNNTCALRDIFSLCRPPEVNFVQGQAPAEPLQCNYTWYVKRD
jgi:hypothetical protein